MDKVLINQDKRQIANYKEFAAAGISHYQTVYDACKALDITVSIEQINEYVGQVRVDTKSTPHRDRYGMADPYRPPMMEYTCNVSDIVRNLLLSAQTENPAIGNLQLDSNKLKELIRLPDTTALEKAFVGLSNFIARYRHMQLHPYLYKIESDKVQLVADADKQISEMWSYYANGSQEIELNAALSEVAEALNKYIRYMDERTILGREIPELDGLKYDGSSKTYHADHYFVSRNAKYIK